MYAIVKIGGMQWKAEESKVLRVPKMDVEPGKTVNLDQVLLFVDQEKVQVGKPVVDGVTVQVEVLSHGKDKKINVFKKKRRKNYNVMKGHRQEYTKIKVGKIGFTKSAPAKVETAAPIETQKVSDMKTAKITKAPAKPRATKAAPKTAKPKATVKESEPKPVKPRVSKKTVTAGEKEKKE